MANWVAIAQGQARYKGIPIMAGEGKLVSEGPWDVVVELRHQTQRAVMARFDRSRGNWSFSVPD
ncbi:MAG: hypothetical protein JJU22_05435 [Gammaproteobacteria bacterium]|nr:hypothetical protein [Gammaproteobacteria bacterium]